MVAFLALAALLPALVAAVPCVQFDAQFNLYAFGGEQDVSLGPSSSWSSPTPKPLSTVGRPPWTGTNTQCLLSQSNNAVYVIGADASDATWSKQTTSGGPTSTGNTRSSAILDHDTNVLFTIPGDSASGAYSLDLGLITNTAAGTAAWTAVGTPPFPLTNYKATAALASNHILYFGVPNTAAGSANLFVIHYNYFQPQAQAYPAVGGSNFPDSSGQATSFLVQNNTVPYQVLFVPDDFSNSYVVTHYTDPGNYNVTTGSPMPATLINSTQILPPPTSKDANAAYAASDSSIVQIDTKGDIYYIADAVTNWQVTPGASWSKLSYSLKPATATPTSASQTGSATGSDAAAASKTGAKGEASSAAVSSTAKPSAAAPALIRKDVLGLALGCAAVAAAIVL
ncbi:hypothetical protein VHUM_01808 [Vanrija humicola]|uniref:Uncharacterized protein n=1 Tax=Vanrija humicola TaxID=5417 RepID=A0A7D8Z1M4_VANHU|nr:hypothetical protein VHUM_01808 [Vanrija humicola]